MTQTERVKAYIKLHGSIDRAQALNALNVFNLPEVIRKLRAKGEDIETVNVKGHNGNYCRYRFKV